MNNPSPLVPQGSLLEQKNQGRARVRLAVFLVLTIHAIGLLALLMQGCKKEPDASQTADQTAAPAATNTAPAFDATNAAPPPTNDLAAAPGTGTSAPAATLEQPPVAPPGAPSEYKIAKGDTFGTLAKKFHVSVKALTDANTAVDPTKLQIGQTVHIPAPPAPAMATGPGTGTPSITDAPGAGEQLYTVKSGDTLTGIAHDKHVTIKALRAANTLKTDSIRVGQKLKIPKTTIPVDSTTNPPGSAGTTGGPGR